MFVKCTLGEDIRRFTLDSVNLNFSVLETQIANLYKIQPGKFRIAYHDEEGDKIQISSNDELAAAVSSAFSNHQNRLRLVIDISEEGSFGNKKMETNGGNSLKFASFSPTDSFLQTTLSFPSLASSFVDLAPKHSRPLEALSNNSTSSTSSTSEQSPSIRDKNESNKFLTNPTATKASTPKATTSTSVNLIELFEKPEFGDQLGQLIADSIASKAFSQMVQRMIPQFMDIMKDTLKTQQAVQSTDVQAKPSPTTVDSANSTSSSSPAPQVEADPASLPVSNPVSVPVAVAITDDTPLQNENSTKSTESSEELNLKKKKNDSPSVDIQPVPADEMDSKQENSTPSNESSKEEQVEVDGEPEPFVLVDNTNQSVEVPLSTSPLLNSLLSFFKPKRPMPIPSSILSEDADHPMPIPNLEEMLEQLKLMGFSDREANIKLLQFHKKFNEGLDAVVDDLLTQSKLTENLKPSPTSTSSSSAASSSASGSASTSTSTSTSSTPPLSPDITDVSK